MALTARVDRILCIGTGDCVSIAPNTFKLDDENKSIVIAQEASDDNILMKAARTCPVAAIILTDPTGKQMYP